MEVSYPIYLLERDDFSFREFTCLRHLEFCEKDDVLEGLYEGWDSNCRHFMIPSQTSEPVLSKRGEPLVARLTEPSCWARSFDVLDTQRCRVE
jgi:hypothetical protein